MLKTINKLNDELALAITEAVGSMWCAYVFAALALLSLPAAISGGLATTITWIAQTFLQLVLLSVIMVGQDVSSKRSDKRAEKTYRDAELILKRLDEIQAAGDERKEILTTHLTPRTPGRRLNRDKET